MHSLHTHVLGHHVSKCSYTNLDMAFVYFLNKQQYIYILSGINRRLTFKLQSITVTFNKLPKILPPFVDLFFSPR